MSNPVLNEAMRLLPLPEPSAGIDAYVAERERALTLDPRKRANYERYLRSSRRDPNPDYLPVKLDIENVSRCNFRCTMCVVSDWPKGRRAGDLSLADFQALIDEQYGLVEIKLQGIGEPSMQGDPYFAMIRYARARHIWVRTTTNASLLHLNDNHRKLIDSDANEIQISIDGATAETFEAIRRGSSFRHVTANCRALHDYAAEKGVCRTKMWTVVQEGNLHELEALVRLGADLGFRHQCFSLELGGWGNELWEERNRRVDVADRVTVERLHGLIDLGRENGIDVRFWHVVEKYSTESPKSLCPWPFERAVVSSDRQVVPCCTIGDPGVSRIDGLEARSLTDVWFGTAYQDFRRAHLERRIPQECRSCYRAADMTPETEA
ncbi:radical SAM protein [Azospirillum sp. Sh1]|uniref:radical SAM protein n=1 Tax=Azospirillum sp. Sh1 TaxID=2607285 RepID=UPI0011F046EB|nr:radical SAM protein [Azospirillum sp. Sh1]KAA0579310.1 radical SAM protein [Azospirillum sp. Sh1]